MATLEEAGALRQQQQTLDLEDSDCIATGRMLRPRIYKIDLSLPPSERYKKLARDFSERLHCLEDLAHELIYDVLPETWSDKHVFSIARLLLRGVYHREETQELGGIAEASGVEMCLLVAFNVLLDALMGCSSGGIRISDDGKASSATRILHYRTLDWAMPELRHLVVQLDFVKGPKSPVICRSITYAGYVGTLTGVRQGLSISLNYRCVRNDKSKWGIMRLRWHQVAVVLGLRPSLPSLIRRALLTEGNSYEQTVKAIESARSTIAYLIFSNGQHVTILEKDYGPSVRHDSDDFLAVTNHDAAAEGAKPSLPLSKSVSASEENAQMARTVQPKLESKSHGAFDIAEGLIVGESIGRRQAMVERFNGCLAVSRSRRYSALPREADVVEWLHDWPITNEMTHYGAVMDPTKGSIVHAVVWPEPARRSGRRK